MLRGATLDLTVVGMEATPSAIRPRACSPDPSDKPGPSKTRCNGHRKVVFYVCTVPLDCYEVMYCGAIDSHFASHCQDPRSRLS